MRMRIPYVVGRWVRGQNHYGRQQLIEYLLSETDSATWLVGTRRMGKTSLLRQLEHVTAGMETSWAPLVWDMQGCQTPEAMSLELEYAISDVRQRFEETGIDTRIAPGTDAVAQLRALSRNATTANKRLLLLVDEAEALLYVAERNPGWLAMLRKVLQEGNLRTIITSTKLLAKLNEINSGWTTSPFMFGFNLANLWQLNLRPSLALIRQEQAQVRVRVDSKLADEILSQTNGHPYLIQHLCQRLFNVDRKGHGYLRPITDDDLEPDHILSGFFRIDFQYLTSIERKLLLCVADHSIIDGEDLLTELSAEQPRRIETFLYGMRKMGYLRASHDRWTIGNEYLRRWIQEQRAEVAHLTGSSIGDAAHEEILRAEQRNESEYLHHEIERLRAELLRLQELQERTMGSSAQDEASAIARVRMELIRAQRELDKISGDF